ncbi:hypothetical protein OG373_13785 [Streptomyces avidinii]|uniref:hypothetical protein n=1 Tax=Streptomyces avidinii TaxID=1895 RepID=UPI00386E5595|nr:hypothetical protein OG373_13785 [Streptomyces avidinii]
MLPELFTDILSGALITTCSTALLAGAATVPRRLLDRWTAAGQGLASAVPLECARTLRRYTLLRTCGPGQYDTTRPSGTVITHHIDGRTQRFELTDVALGDGTYAAEPID